MRVLLDTNVLINFFHGVPRVGSLLQGLEKREFYVSVLTVMEIIRGAHKTDTPKQFIDELKSFVEKFTVRVVAVDEEIGVRCGELLASMEKRGIRLDAVDGLLAATAIKEGLALISEDKVFKKVPGLDVYDQAS